MLRIVIITAYILSSASLLAQHAYWHFGFGAALHFNPNPTVLYNSALFTDEGCTSVSNTNGQLLFYSNGETVWNNNNLVIQNGSGIFGHYSSTQSVLSVPVFKDTNQYILFTLDAQAGSFNPTTGGLSYSVIDMSLQNGSGSVISKNNALLTPACEGMTATKNYNQTETWVIVHRWNSNQFYSYRVDCEGTVHNPVISATGWTRNSNFFNTNEGTLGSFAMNEEGSLLASIFTQQTDANSSFAVVELFSFDNLSGKLVLKESFPIDVSNDLDERGYGIQFSPNGSKLYCTTYGLNQGISYQRLYQFDVTQNPISTSKYVVSDGGKPYGTIQRAPDNKLYIARLNGSKYLSSIDNPDQKGVACNFISKAIDLSPLLSTWGLPNHWDWITNKNDPPLLSLQDTIHCAENELQIKAMQPYPGAWYEFTWNNGQQGLEITIRDSGTYYVQAILNCDTIIDSIKVTMQQCFCNLFIPNSFTPNGDGHNDVLKIEQEDCYFHEFKFAVYNRFGTKVYSANKPDFEWEGNNFPTGVYVYRGDYKHSGTNSTIVKTGTITLIR